MLSKSYTKYIQSLQHKRQRDEEGLFIAEGPKLVPELLATNVFDCRELVALQTWIDDNLELLSIHTMNVQVAEAHELEKLSGLSMANNVLAVFEKRTPLEDFDTAGKIVLVLEGIQDPGNMGTLIRIADWFAIENIIASEQCADMYNPKVVQSSMGSIARVNVLYTDIIEWLGKHPGLPVLAATLGGQPLATIGKLKEGIIVIGNESKGISAEMLELASQEISIPGKGGAESLNAAVAAGIVLAHLVDN